MAGKLSVIKIVLCGILLFGIGVVVLNFLSYGRRLSDATLTQNDDAFNPFPPADSVRIEITADFKSNIKPAELTAVDKKIDISNVSIRRYRIPSKNKKNKGILVRESGKGTYNVLLLHGRDLSSKILEEISTLQYLSQWGYRAFAIDIPDNEMTVEEAIRWLTGLIQTLDLKNLVLISSSISGQLTLPYIFQLNEKQQSIKGFVAIAPVGREKFHRNDYKKIKIPTLIIHGEQDRQFQSAFENLQKLPASEILSIKNAPHSSYSEQSVEFHNRLRQFLYNIYRPIYQNHFKLSKKQSSVSNTTKYKIKRIKKLHQ